MQIVIMIPVIASEARQSHLKKKKLVFLLREIATLRSQ